MIMPNDFLNFMSGLGMTQVVSIFAPPLALLAVWRFLPRAEACFRGAGASWWLPFLLVGVITVNCMFASTASTLWDRDEPRYARAAVEMMRSGSLMVPTFNGEYRLHKPILVYWLMQPAIRVLGATELGVRFLSIIAFAICCLLIQRLGALFRSPRTGLVAFAAVSGTPLAMVNGTASTTDSLLLLCTTSAFAVAYYCSRRGLRPVDALPIGAALGAAQLTKGPVGLFIPLFSIFAAAGMKGSPARRSRSVAVAVAAVLFGAALFYAWFCPANSITNGAFYDFAFKEHVVHRSFTAMEGHGGNLLINLPYYLPVVMVGFFPWVLFLPGGIYALVSGRILPGRDRLFFSMWIFPPLILMSVVATKLPHYILPIWPALGLLAATAIEESEGGEADPGLSRWMRRGLWIFVPVGAILTVTLLSAPWFLSIEGLWPGALGAGLTVGIMAIAASREHCRRRFTRGAMLLFAGMLLFQATLSAALLPKLEAIKVSPGVASIVRNGTPPGTPVTTFKYLEPSLVFYLDRGVVGSLPGEAAVAAWAKEKGPGVIILPRSALETVVKEHGPVPLVEIGSKKGLNLGKVGRVEIVVLKRDGEEGLDGWTDGRSHGGDSGPQ